MDSQKEEVLPHCLLNSKILQKFEDVFVLAVSLRLSAAFEIVNVELLLKPLKILGLLYDVINLIGEWLTNRFYYIDIMVKSSNLFDLLLGTVQGSILGPILFEMFASPF
jgi:hypothetical protein